MRSQVVGFQKSLEQYPENPWILEGLATYFIGLGEPADAIRILKKRVQTGPPAVYPTASIGMAMLASGDPIQAEEQDAKQLHKMVDTHWRGWGLARH